MRCGCWESNPAPDLGRVEYYRYTTSAFSKKWSPISFYLADILGEWTLGDLNPQPLPCHGSALPLRQAPSGKSQMALSYSNRPQNLFKWAFLAVGLLSIRLNEGVVLVYEEIELVEEGGVIHVDVNNLPIHVSMKMRQRVFRRHGGVSEMNVGNFFFT